MGQMRPGREVYQGEPEESSFYTGATRPGREVYQGRPEESSFYAGVGAAVGLVANPVVLLSLYSVASTGAALPQGPFGLVGTLQGVSGVVVVAMVVLASVNKARTGRGLPEGPLGLLGFSEELSRLTLLCALVVFPFNEIGIVGDPQTALIDVPALAESVRAALGAIVASLLPPS